MKKVLLLIALILVIFSCEMPMDEEELSIDYDVYVNYDHDYIIVDRTTYDENGNYYSSVKDFHDYDGTYHYSYDNTSNESISIYFEFEFSDGTYDSGWVNLDKNNTTRYISY